MSDSTTDLSSKDIQEKYTTYSNNLKKTVKDLYDLHNLCKSRKDVNSDLRSAIGISYYSYQGAVRNFLLYHNIQTMKSSEYDMSDILRNVLSIDYNNIFSEDLEIGYIDKSFFQGPFRLTKSDIFKKAYSFMPCLNPEHMCLWRPEDIRNCLKSIQGYDIDSEDLVDNGNSSAIVSQFNNEFLKAVQVFSIIRDCFGERKYKEYVNEFIKGIKEKILIENASRKTKKKGTRKRIQQNMLTCISNDICKLLSQQSSIKNPQKSQSDCNDKDISTLSTQSNDKDISSLSTQSNDKDISTQSNDKDMSTQSIQSGNEDRSKSSKKRQYSPDYDVEDDDNEDDYCDIKRKRVSAEQRKRRSDINRKNSNKRWHKDE